ncbi:two-component system response regulator [Enterovibrio norvegicus]|uniref:Response regulator receiver domain-containing protein n=2 Tax=Enterovibrio norvegicus TaxID=188144 RepID=A0A1I5N7X2_9GAMM|nr:response regulator [Enterovibrio norvegicus]OEF59615.1 two-component system response regulator [Enterovibrio norvegicus]SFP17949.1 Response regulator receiver domain-containing protein [Enterovibrio norvegicus DSM 15893]
MLDGKEVLIVEDDPVFSKIIASFLRHEGCVVREAENGLDGLKALREGIPDLLLSDLSMPVMTGLEFVEEVSLEYPMLPVIVISGTGGMSDVAQALRFGVKDFLIKPIDDIMVVKSAILSVLEESDSCTTTDTDFSQQWFKVSQNAEQPLTEELKWHLDDLLDNPGSARDLLMGLMPEQDSQQGDWRLSYHSLQSADSNPVVLDYMWMMDGKMAFYMVDSGSAGKNGTATTLMIRAFFNEYLRSQDADERGFIHLVHQIEHAIKKSTYASPIRAMFGILNASDNQLDVLSAGLNAVVDGTGNAVIVKNDFLLGIDAASTQFQAIDLSGGSVRVSLSEVGLTSFSLDIQRLTA